MTGSRRGGSLDRDVAKVKRGLDAMPGAPGCVRGIVDITEEPASMPGFAMLLG